MKRIVALIFAIMLILYLCVCGEYNTGENINTESTPSVFDTTSDVTSSEAASSDETLEEIKPEGEETESSDQTSSFDHYHEHNYVAALTKPPTCVEEGVITFSCGCGDSHTQIVSPRGHAWGEWGSGDNPQRTCSNCGATEKKTVVNLPITESKDYFVEE